MSRRPAGAARMTALIATLLVPLAGCVTTEAPSSEPTPVEARLMASQRRIADAIDALRRAQSAAVPREIPIAVDPASVPSRLRLPVTWSWQGPVDTALSTLAERIGFTTRVHGLPPTTPILVSVDASDRPVVQVVESIGNQIVGRGVVRLDVDAGTIDLFYSTTR